MGKRLGVLITALLIVALVAFSSVSAVNPWAALRKEKGTIVGRGGSLVTQPGQAEVLDFVQALDRITGRPSVDPVTGQPKQLVNKGVNRQLKTATVDVFEGELIGKVSVDYFEDSDGQQTVFTSAQNQRPAYIVPIPIGNKFLMEYEGSLYLIDLREKKASPFLSLSLSGYEESNAKDWRISWGTLASVNPAGTTVLFTTNRLSLIKQDDNFDRHYQIWIKDLVSGEERHVADGTYQRVLGWDGDIVYLAEHEIVQERAAESVVALNLSTGEQQVLLRGLVSCAATYPFLVYTTYDSTLDVSALEVLNILDGNKKTIPGLKYDRYESIASTPRSKFVLIIAQPSRTSHTRDVVILDTETLQTRILPGDEETVFRNYGFVDANTITVTVARGDNEEETYIVGLQEGR